MNTELAKQSLKSRTIKFNLVMVPILTYLISVPELWSSYLGVGANAALVIGNIVLRALTSEPLSAK